MAQRMGTRPLPRSRSPFLSCTLQRLTSSILLEIMDDLKIRHSQVTLSHLLLGMAVVMPAVAAISSIRVAGAGVFRIALGLILGLAIGSCICILDLQICKFLRLRSAKYAEKARKLIDLGLFALLFIWILAGVIAGNNLARWIVG